MLTRVEIEALVAEACVARDAGMARATAADRSGWDTNLIDQAISWFARGEHPFSANDLRELFPPDVRQPLIGARFSAWAMADLIVSVGAERSTKRNTHCKKVALWRGNPDEPKARSSAPPWVRAALDDYRTAVAQWEEQRESGRMAPAAYAFGAQIAMYQLEDDEYAKAFPRPRFTDFVSEHAARRRNPERAAS